MRRVAIGGLAAAAVVAASPWWCGRRAPADTSSAAVVPRFVDDTAAAGVDHRYAGDFEFFVGGGVAAFDCNDDGLDELYFAGGVEPAALYRNESPIGGALRFVEQASPVTDLTEVTGAYPLDIDSDRQVDLVVLRRGGNVVLRGLGDCRFEAANDSLGIDGGDDWTVAFSATWEGANALPTLAFGSYLVPGDSTCADSRLVRPGGDRRHLCTPRRARSGVLHAVGAVQRLESIGSARPANGERSPLLPRRLGTAVAHRPGEAPRLYTEADGWRPLQLWGMGIASRDLTGDGAPEVFITSQGDNKLQTLDGDPTTSVVPTTSRSSGASPRSVRTSAVTCSPPPPGTPSSKTSTTTASSTCSSARATSKRRSTTRHSTRATCSSATPTAPSSRAARPQGSSTTTAARGAALVDLNLDGMLDLVEVNRQVNVKLWRNVGQGDADTPAPMGHWLAVRLQQDAPNVDAIGAFVEVRLGDRTLTREITVGGGHAGGKLGWIHTGLGAAENAEVRVTWPDGEVGPWMDVGADQFVSIERGATEPRPWSLAG